MPTKKPPLKTPAPKPIIKMNIIARVRQSMYAYRTRRPHRSFRMTRRRDYVRPLTLPGYWVFTLDSFSTIWSHRKLFFLLAAVYALLTSIMVGIGSQDAYNTLTNTIGQTSGTTFNGFLGGLGRAGLLFLTTSTGGLSQTFTQGQQIYTALIILLAWLTTVWLLRNILAGHKVKLRDGIYNAGAPIISTFIICLVLIVQLLPIGLAAIGYNAAVSTGLLGSGVEAMLFWVVAGLLTLMSAYWITSTAMALVVVTLPGMYPFRALKVAGDLVIGRRLRILLRIVWLLASIAIVWAVVMIPIILIDSWVKSMWSTISWLPTVPVVMLVLSSLTVIWAASYIYLLYRRIVADDSAPA